MVNETNKPQQDLENDELGQRLAASNQALADMQAEHRQLLEEMEQLRRRAEDLQRLREQQDREEAERQRQYQQSLAAAAAEEAAKPKEESEDTSKTEEKSKESNNEEGEDPEEAEYIREKLAEIARLKAQLKRVQHMVNTTELIENHISKHEALEKSIPKEVPAKPKPAAKPAAVATAAASSSSTSNPVIPSSLIPPPVASTPIELLTMPDMPTMADLEAATTTDEKEQLILTMLNMFQDFSSDLRSQADNLRAERARIKDLKECILKAKKEPQSQ